MPSVNASSRATTAAASEYLADGSTGSHFMSDLAARVQALSIDAWGERGAVEMVGQSQDFLALQSKLEKVARYKEPVLLIGESGVGKEHFSQAIYLLSERRGRPYVSVNCPQYQEGNLTVSELFGHRKGSFTGAIADRKGAFETADGGVMFLDEVGDLNMSAQTMLLRALASGEFKPLGLDTIRSADVRVVAATNRPLNQLMTAQEFRNDLFFRLRYFLLRVPPLRQRGEDWRLILDYRLLKLRQKYGVAKRFSPDAIKLIATYPWPGNVRQLISVATMGYAMADGDTIAPQDIAAQLEMGDESRTESTQALYHSVVVDGAGFWEVVARPFLERDLNRAQVKAFVHQGLVSSGGSYRRLLDLLRLPVSDYQRFMDFLRHHDLKPQLPRA